MRLAVVSPFIDRRHGTERALAELLERLARDYGCEIHLYSQRVEDISLSDPRSPRSNNSGAIFWRKVPSVPGPHLVQFLAWMFFNGFLRRRHAFFGGGGFDLVLSPGINSLHPDVVIVHALFHRLQALTDEGEEKEEKVSEISFFRRLHRRVYYALLARLESRIYSDRTIALAAVSGRTARLLEDSFHREDICVIQNGVDTEYFNVAARLARRSNARQRRGFHDDDFVLLLIGNDWRVKGLPTILEAMATLPKSRTKLLVVGEDAVEPFRALAKRLGVEDRCLWEAAGSDALDFYSVADVYVSPSREDSFGLPVAEAMACGLPAITSIFAGVGDYLSDGVDSYVMRDPRDARALGGLIERLRTDAGLSGTMGDAAARKALEWSWDRNAEAIWELLKDSSMRAGASRV